MIPWIWFLSIGGALFLLMRVVYGAHIKIRSHVHRDLLYATLRAADANSAPSSLRIDPLRGVRGEPNQAPRSEYLGQVWVFDSVEHRDMFEANQHTPVAIDLVSVTSRRTGPSIQR